MTEKFVSLPSDLVDSIMDALKNAGMPGYMAQAEYALEALASLGFGGRIEAFSYVMGVVSVILWVMVYNLSPFMIALITGT